jgi:hypothetical protein
MAKITYNVARRREDWVVTRDGIATMNYDAQHAAFAAAVATADQDLRSGHSVGINVAAGVRFVRPRERSLVAFSVRRPPV